MIRRLVRSVPPWVLLLAILVVTAVWSLIPLYGPTLPGTLRLGVVPGEDPAVLHRAFAPLADYLGRSVRRSGRVQVLDAGVLARGHGADLLLVAPGAVDRAGYEVLAWSKPVGRVRLRSPLLWVRSVDAPEDSLRVGYGDATLRDDANAGLAALLARGLPIDRDAVVVGSSPYRHDEILVLLGHGALDAVVVRREDLDRGFGAGLVDAGRVRIESLGEAPPRFVLLAGPSLSEPARRRIRTQALNLDHFRLNPNHGSAAAVTHALGQVGLGGFAPVEPFPNLRP